MVIFKSCLLIVLFLTVSTVCLSDPIITVSAGANIYDSDNDWILNGGTGKVETTLYFVGYGLTPDRQHLFLKHDKNVKESIVPFFTKPDSTILRYKFGVSDCLIKERIKELYFGLSSIDIYAKYFTSEFFIDISAHKGDVYFGAGYSLGMIF